MPTLNEILEDTKTYPNDRKITLADGVETTLGEVRSGYMKDSDYRKKTSEVANQRREFERERTEFLAAKQEAELQLEQLASRVLKQDPNQNKEELDATLNDDPVAQKLMGKINALEQKLGESYKYMQSAEQRLKQHEDVFVASQHRQVMEKIKHYDKDLDEGQLIDFCKQNQIPNLVNGYRLMTEEKRMAAVKKAAEDEAFKKGMEEGKKQITQTRIPSRRTILKDQVDESAPKTFDEAAEAALNDPEIMDALEGTRLGL